MKRQPGVHNARQRGFTYLGLMFLVAMLALTAAAAGPVWRVVAQGERERELLFVGAQFRAAIEQYQRRSPPGAARYPQRLEDLLRDPRALTLVRDLRRLYADPFDFKHPSGTPRWGLVRSRDGGIIGVHSLSTSVPLKRSGFAPGLAFESARSHRDWRFIAPSAASLAVATESHATEPDTPALRADPPPPPPPTAPEATAPDNVAANPRPPRQADYRNRSPDACQRIAAYDLLLCAQQAAQFGAAAERDCLNSAVQRTVVCPFPAEPLPPLFLRNQ